MRYGGGNGYPRGLYNITPFVMQAFIALISYHCLWINSKSAESKAKMLEDLFLFQEERCAGILPLCALTIWSHSY